MLSLHHTNVIKVKVYPLFHEKTTDLDETLQKYRLKKHRSD